MWINGDAIAFAVDTLANTRVTSRFGLIWYGGQKGAGVVIVSREAHRTLRVLQGR